MKTNRPTCEHPVLIVSPSLNEDILRSDYLLIDGIYHTITSSMRGRVLAGEKASRILHLPYVKQVVHKGSEYVLEQTRYNEDYISRYLLINSRTGEMYPCYTLVSCGKCDVCQSKRLNSLLQRCTFQALQDKQVPMFFTLTYNDSHVPSDGVCLADVVNFKKRFRTWYSRIFHRPSNDLKFIVCPEYGKKIGHRPHYHCLVFGWSADDPQKTIYYNHVIKLRFLQFCWRTPSLTNRKRISDVFNKYIKDYPLYYNVPTDYDPCSYGFVNLEQLNSTSCAATYVTKYVTKGCDIPHGKNPLFRTLISPNMGVDFVKSYAKDLHNKDKFMYLDTFDGKTKESNLCGYYIHKLYPSYSKLIPADFRKSFFNVISATYVLEHLRYRTPEIQERFVHFCKQVRSSLCKRFSFMDLHSINYVESIKMPFNAFDFQIDSNGDIVSQDPIFRNLICDYYCLVNTDIDIKSINKRIAHRDKFFERFVGADLPNLSALGARYRQIINTSISKSKL